MGQLGIGTKAFEKGPTSLARGFITHGWRIGVGIGSNYGLNKFGVYDWLRRNLNGE